MNERMNPMGGVFRLFGIAQGSDLDDIKSDGGYDANRTVISQSLSNSPTHNPFVMYVIRCGNVILQVIIPVNKTGGLTLYYRTMYFDAGSQEEDKSWYSLTGIKVDMLKPASDPAMEGPE